MIFLTHSAQDTPAWLHVFKEAFTASEGHQEGTRIETLVADLFANTAPHDLCAVAAQANRQVIAACVFTRLLFAQDERQAFILSPLAVATAFQGQGVGQALVQHGLSTLRTASVDVVMTYGDPRYYGRFGFQSVSVGDATPPWPLTYPSGWMGLSLTEKPWSGMRGPSTCAPALNDPVFW